MEKINWLYKFGCNMSRKYIETFCYKLVFEGDLPKAPYVLLPKHQKMMDILAEGAYIMEKTGQTANFVMREFSNRLYTSFLELIGGIPIVRACDVRKRKYTIEQIKEKNEQAVYKTINALIKKEPVVIHPEETRSYRAMHEIKIKNNSMLEQLMNAQEQTGPINFVPMGILYEERCHIHLRTGQPIQTKEAQELEEYLKIEIPKLSGIKN